jgi:hypothetical protein
MRPANDVDSMASSIVGSLTSPIKQYQDTLKALQQLGAAGSIGPGIQGQLTNQAQSSLLQSAMPSNFADAYINQLAQMQIATRNATQDMGRQFASIFGPSGELISGIADATGRSIAFGDNFGQAVAQVAQSIEAELISALVKMGINMLLNATLGESVATAALAASVAQATATAAAWAPAASMVSLATFGANSAAAIAGITTTVGVASGLSAAAAIPGFANGVVGLQGPGTGTSDSIPAWLSRGESVITDQATRGNKDTLRAMNAGANFDNMLTPTRGGGDMHVTVENHTSAGVQVQRMSPTQVRIIVKEEISKAAPGIVGAAVQNAEALSPNWVAKANRNPRMRAR